MGRAGVHAAQTDIAFMRLALEQAQKAYDAGEFPVGAVVTRGGAVIACAHNEREALRDPTAHAEMLAIRAAANALGGWRLVGCSIYVTLEPCPMCAGAIALARPERLVFGAYDAAYGCCGSRYDLPGDRAFGPRADTVGGVLAEESRALLAAFGKRLRGRG